MSKQKNKSDFNVMNVAELKQIFAGTSSFSKRCFENFASGNRLCSRKNGFASGSKLRKFKPMMHILIIHVMLIPNVILIPNPFSLKTVNNFNSSPPFGLCDIINYLI